MKIDSYRCNFCNKIFDYSIPDSTWSEKGFPNQIPCECGKWAKRLVSSPYSIVHQGKAGNAKNGYSSNQVSIKKT